MVVAQYDLPDGEGLFVKRPCFRIVPHKFLIKRQSGSWHAQDDSGVSFLSGSEDQFDTIEIRPEKTALLAIGNEKLLRYRGRFRLIALSSDLFAVVNVVDIEQYLAGVVGAEMPAYWYMAALRAQSIASRTGVYSVDGQFF